MTKPPIPEKTHFLLSITHRYFVFNHDGNGEDGRGKGGEGEDGGATWTVGFFWVRQRTTRRAAAPTRSPMPEKIRFFLSLNHEKRPLITCLMIRPFSAIMGEATGRPILQTSRFLQIRIMRGEI